MASHLAKTLLSILFGAMLVVIGPQRAVAQCDLALVLGLDASSSVSPAEYDLQLQGIAWALRDPDVKLAMLQNNGIWLSVFEWSGQRQQQLHADWQLLNTDEKIENFASRISTSERRYAIYPTAVGSALAYASNHLRDMPANCERKVFDISGDGIHNDGFPPALAFREFQLDSVIINALVITGEKPDPVEYFRKEVINGAGSFVQVAHGYGSFAQAMKRKLLREIYSNRLSSVVAFPSAFKQAIQ